MSPGILAIQGCHDKAGSQLILLTMGIGLDCRLGDFFLERFLLLFGLSEGDCLEVTHEPISAHFIGCQY